MIKYKIVYVTQLLEPLPDRYTSCIVEGKALIEYKVGSYMAGPSWLTILGHHPTVFRTFRDAAHWLSDCDSNVKIFECECKESIPLSKRAEMFLLSEGRISHIKKKWPTGTEMFKKVKLIKEVKMKKVWL